MVRVRFFLLAVLVSAMAGATTSTANAGSCGTPYALFGESFKCYYQFRHCYENAENLVRPMVDKGVDVSKVNVLYIANHGDWDMHVVVQYDGKIFDPDRFTYLLEKNDLKVRGIPVDEFFRGMRHPGSDVRLIPAQHYLNHFPSSGPEQFMLDFPACGTGVDGTCFRTLPLADFLAEQSPK